MTAGRLSAADFELGLDHVTRRLAAVPSDLAWSLTDVGSPRELVLRFTRPLPSLDEPVKKKEEEEVEILCDLKEEEEETDLQSVSVGSPGSEELQLELRVTYSAAHEVPVLFCRAWHLRSTKPASLEQLWRLFSSQTGSTPGSDLLNALGPAEHPPTGLPMFVLHPCKTAQVMATLQPTSPKRFVLAWLSVFGPALGLGLPCAVFDERVP